MRLITIIRGEQENQRIMLGIQYLEKALRENGYQVKLETAGWEPVDYREGPGDKIYVGVIYSVFLPKVCPKNACAGLNAPLCGRQGYCKVRHAERCNAFSGTP